MAEDQHRKDPPLAAASPMSHNHRLPPASRAPSPPPSPDIEDSWIQQQQQLQKKTKTEMESDSYNIQSENQILRLAQAIHSIIMNTPETEIGKIKKKWFS